MTHRQSQADSDAPSPRIYMVGGAVRDQLLGRPVQDRDWVVVGATPQWMSAQGFTPVGKDFPVFLHPQTHEEYALARTERKSGRGYKGFTVYADPSVTLEQDLARRDLTINAIAMRQLADGRQEWVDPYGGRADLQRKRLRHVSAAFAEDPLRILRLARFAARFADFSIAEDTMALMRGMVQAGEAAHLVPERVWQELARGLMEHAPQAPAPVAARRVGREALLYCGARSRLSHAGRAVALGAPRRPPARPAGHLPVHLYGAEHAQCLYRPPVPRPGAARVGGGPGRLQRGADRHGAQPVSYSPT